MATKTLILAGTSYQRFEKNEDGDKVRRRYRQGDEVEVSSAVAETLLTLEVGGRHIFVESEEEAKREEENLPRNDVGAGDPRAAVRQSTLTSQTAPKSAK